MWQRRGAGIHWHELKELRFNREGRKIKKCESCTVERAKQDEKETKKLQDNVQSLQLRLGARENLCKNLQDKVRDLENQLAEERKTRLKQEARALEKFSVYQPALSLSNQAQTDKKPPLAPSKFRLPLRRISNLMPVSSPAHSKKNNMSFLPVVNEDKENSNTSRAAPQLKDNNRSRPILKPRRGSIAVRPSTNQVVPPKRRASIATLRPESNMTTPIQRSSVRSKTDRIVGRQSYVWDPQRVWRTSRVSSPLPQSRDVVSTAAIEATPVGRASMSSKFRGSPPSQTAAAGSWKPKHPTVVALQKKHLVWSPLKLKCRRSSLMS